MTALMVEAAFRSMALAVLVWTTLTVLRVRASLSQRWRWTPLNPQVERITWTMVLLGALAMPLVIQQRLPVFPTATFTVPDITIAAAQGGSEHHWYTALVSLYVGVALILFARLAIGFGRMWRIVQRAVRIREPWTEGADIRVSDAVSGPVTFGSTILLPATHAAWSETKRAVILTHELSHARHADCHIQWLAALHECVFWFSPLAWWLRRHLADVAEQASDDCVLRSNIHRADYAAVLLEVAQERPTSSVTLSMASGRMASRIERILATERPSRPTSLLQRAAAVLCIVPLIAFAGQSAAVDATSTTAASTSARTQPAGTPQSVEPPSTTRPYIVTAGALEPWYPEDAKHRGIEGLVRITVTVDTAGRATDTHVVSEYPEDMGFAAAASGLVHTFTYANPTGHPAALTFAVKFALQ